MCGRVCLPTDLFDEFVRAKGGDEAEADAYARQFFRDWNTRYSTGDRQSEVVGANGFTFWRARWGESHPNATAAQQRTDTAVEDSFRKQRAEIEAGKTRRREAGFES